MAQAAPLNTSNMTDEQLKARRTRMVEGAKFGRPLHENIMLIALKVWLLLGPPAFVALTTSEVAYIFASLLPPGDSGDKIILLGALFVDLAMMFTTFGVALKRRDLASKTEANGGVVDKKNLAEVRFGTGLWLVFALINVVGQCAFLLHIVQSNPHPGDLNLIYLFIAARVIGFILGDATTAFFLAKVDNSELKLIARSEREKGIIYAELAKAEGERKYTEAKADADIMLLQLKVQAEKDDAEFLASIKRKAFASALNGSPPPDDSRSSVRRSDR